MDELKGWAEILGDWGSKYLDYRRVESQDAIEANRLRYQQQAELQARQSSALPGWLLPTVLIGGAVVAVFLLLKK